MTITLKNVSASYPGTQGIEALHDLTFNVQSGRRLSILGENGSGKTSLLRVLTGILPYEGEILIDKKELRTLSRAEISARIAHLQQMSGAYFSYIVEETVSHGRYLREKGGALFQRSKKDRDAVEKILETTHLTDIRDRKIDTLSGGQLQRVFLARAFAQETPVLLLDEPTNHLDLKYQAELEHYLTDWTGKETRLPDGSTYRNTMIGVFHDLPLALRLAEDVVLLKDGRLLWSGDKKNLLQKPELLQETFDTDVRQLYSHLFT